MWILTNPPLDYIIFIYSPYAKFQGDQRLIAMSLINCLNSNFCSLKYCIKDYLMDRMINNIQLTWKLLWMLRTYITWNSMVGLWKYEFYNNLLGGVTLLRVIPSIIWTQPYIEGMGSCYI